MKIQSVLFSTLAIVIVVSANIYWTKFTHAETANIKWTAETSRHLNSGDTLGVPTFTYYLPPETTTRKAQGTKVKNTLGTYTGTFVLKSSRSFNNFACTPTQSFPAALAVTGKVKRPSGQLGNLPFGFSGSATEQGATLKGVFNQGTIKRTYSITIRNVKKDSATITLSEVVVSGGKKGCNFVHRATFQRS